MEMTFLISLLVVFLTAGVFFTLLGYFLGRAGAKRTLEDYKLIGSDLEAKLDACRQNSDKLQTALNEATDVDNLEALQRKHDSLERQLVAANNSNKIYASELMVRDQAIQVLKAQLQEAKNASKS